MAYNYERTAYVEATSMAPKAPLTASIAAIEGHEDIYGTLNSSNHAVVPFNEYDEQGRRLSPPSRISPPQPSTAWQAAAQQSLGDISAGFGMYEANLGQKSNETSGKAILARQHEGDTATFNFVDNARHAIEHGYKIMMSMAPALLDSTQIIRILGQDDESSFVQVNPNQAEAHIEGINPQTGKKVVSINPSIGKYDLIVSTGPGFTTRRQESLAMMQEMVNGNPQIFSMIGDLIMNMTDAPGADKLAKRLQVMLPPEIQQMESKDSEQSPEVAQVKAQADQAIQAKDQQIEEMTQAMQGMHEELQQKQIEVQDQKFNAQKIALDAKHKEVNNALQKFQDAQAMTTQGEEKDAVVMQSLGVLSHQLDELRGLQLESEQAKQEQDMERENDTQIVDAIQELAQGFTTALQQVQEQNLGAMEEMTKAILAPRTASVTLPNSGKVVTVQSVSTVNLE
jgi:uncharacterized protein (DUF2344 family)